jgi:small-conductance mechanosensitive channel
VTGAEILHHHAFQALAIFIAVAVLALAADRYFLAIAHRLTRKTETEIDDVIIEALHRPLSLLLVLLGLHLAVARLDIPAEAGWYARAAVFVMSVMVGVSAVSRFLKAFLKWYAEDIARRTHDEVDHKFLPLLYRIGRIFLVVTGAILVLHRFHFDVSSLVVSLGVGSLAIGLAAQDTIANVIAGFLIMLDKPFRIGDRVELTGGAVGDVVDIGLRSTRVQNFDGNILIVPNRQLVNERLVNYGYPSAARTMRLDISAAYGSPVGKVKAVLMECARAVPQRDSLKEPSVALREFTESSMNFTVTAWLKDYRNWLDAVDFFHTMVERRFREEGIEMPFPQRVVHVKQDQKPT